MQNYPSEASRQADSGPLLDKCIETKQTDLSPARLAKKGKGYNLRMKRTKAENLIAFKIMDTSNKCS